MRNTISLLTIILWIQVSLYSCTPTPFDKALSLAGKNKPELESALSHFDTDSTKRERDACMWLIENMPQHEFFSKECLHNYENAYEEYTALRRNGGWVGLDLGRPQKLSHIMYAPRNRDNFIRHGDVYELFYWASSEKPGKSGWQSIGIQKAASDSLNFLAPKGALLYLRNHTRGKDERAFTIDSLSGIQIF